MRLRLDHCSLAGPRERNEDYAGAAVPDGEVLQAKGVLVVVADGVGGHARGQEAAEHAVRSLLADYYATPDTWSVEQSLDTVIQAVNRWLLAEGRRARQSAGMATTLTAMVLRGRRFHLAHVGDSRAYLLRGGALSQLSEDHTWEHPELSNVLRRAVGLDQHLQIDHRDGDLEPGDCFLLNSDGVWNALDDSSMSAVLRSQPDPALAAAQLVQAATQAGSQDNCTALVVAVDEVGGDTLRDRLLSAAQLPLPPRLQPGELIDGLTVRQLIHDSRVTRLYRVERPHADGTETLVLKTLREDASDDEARAALVHEEWLARRALGAAFPQVSTHPDRRHLYYLMRWYDGETLAARLARGHRFDPDEVSRLGIRLLRGVASLHRLAITHRDIKPANLHLDREGHLRVLDLGVAAADSDRFREINNPGTPSYMAPELLAGEQADVASDLYACGVTLYELLTRHFPYGEIEPFQHPVFGTPVPPTRYRPETPAWLENLLLKAVAVAPAQRFETAEEFLLALERGAHRPLASQRRAPLVQRNPPLALKVLVVVSLLLNLLFLILLLSRR
ncbi:MAG: bifunctional protein-serine/threonine kinase/phosphatase [Pseudomonadota bacterium]|nr:bifunctional protein-serine/threonine kinase/phosphatase [Pseudomonadota bacterium]